jgi:hypothetical protein
LPKPSPPWVWGWSVSSTEATKRLREAIRLLQSIEDHADHDNPLNGCAPCLAWAALKVLRAGKCDGVAA